MACQLARQMDNVLCQASARHHLRLLLTRRIPSVVIPITMFAEHGLCMVVPVNANIGGAKARFRPRSEAVNDQLGLRRKDMDGLCYGSQSKADYSRLIERLKRGV